MCKHEAIRMDDGTKTVEYSHRVTIRDVEYAIKELKWNDKECYEHFPQTLEGYASTVWEEVLEEIKEDDLAKAGSFKNYAIPRFYKKLGGDDKKQGETILCHQRLRVKKRPADQQSNYNSRKTDNKPKPAKKSTDSGGDNERESEQSSQPQYNIRSEKQCTADGLSEKHCTAKALSADSNTEPALKTRKQYAAEAKALSADSSIEPALKLGTQLRNSEADLESQLRNLDSEFQSANHKVRFQLENCTDDATLTNENESHATSSSSILDDNTIDVFDMEEERMEYDGIPIPKIATTVDPNRYTPVTILMCDTIATLQSRKMVKVLFDSGSTRTLIKRDCLPNNAKTKEKARLSKH